jgi:hypothetical protein
MRTFPEIEPQDEHDAELLANVHPRDWNNPEPADRYNLVVIGAGTGGLITAAVAAGLGARVALVERHLLGGDCLNVGCVPSKAVIRSARRVHEARSAGALGFGPAPGADVDFGAAMARMRAIRARISEDDSARRYQHELGVDVFLGDGRFVARDAIEVGGARLRFKKAVIATGARAVEPAIEGLAEAGFLTNETVFSLTERPKRLAVIGGGPIGCELAQAFQRLGSQVTLMNDTESSRTPCAATASSSCWAAASGRCPGTARASVCTTPVREAERQRSTWTRSSSEPAAPRTCWASGWRTSAWRSTSARACRWTTSCGRPHRASSRWATSAWAGSSPTLPTPPPRSRCRTRSSSAGVGSRRW